MHGGWLVLALILGGCAASPMPAAPEVRPTADAAVMPAPTALAPIAPSPAPVLVPTPLPIATRVASHVLPAPAWSFALLRDGSAWLNCDGQVIEIMPDGTVQPRFRVQGFLSQLHAVKGDQLWETTSASGATRRSPTGDVVGSYAAPSGDWVDVPLAVDEAGGVWVGYDFGQRLYRYDADGTRTLDLEGGALLTDPRGGVVVVRGLEAVRLSTTGAVVDRRRLPDPMSNLQVAADGTLWGFVQGGKELWGVRPDGTFGRHVVDRVSPANLHVGPQDAWFTDRGALVRLSLATDEQVAMDLGPGFNAIGYGPAGAIWASYQRQSPHPDGVSERGLVARFEATADFWTARGRG